MKVMSTKNASSSKSTDKPTVFVNKIRLISSIFICHAEKGFNLSEQVLLHCLFIGYVIIYLNYLIMLVLITCSTCLLAT